MARSLIAGIDLYSSPWVSGTRAKTYFGPISVEAFVYDYEVTDRATIWTAAEYDILDRLRWRALFLGANAVVGVEVTLDPFARCPLTNAPGLKLIAVGTAADLEAAWVA